MKQGCRILNDYILISEHEITGIRIGQNDRSADDI